MREPTVARMLPDGRRLHLHDGPIDLIIQADGTGQATTCAYEAAVARFIGILDELCAELPALRSPASRNSARLRGPVAQRMFEAVRPYGNSVFITPMAAVAGAVAEAVLAAMTRVAELDRAYVNDGGDIALYLASGQSYRIGMVERPDAPSLFGSVEISSASPVRGVATSGWRGRSFSLGIADAVTVLAAGAPEADAAATVIANAVDLPGHPAICRFPAREIAPDSDLGERLVTRDVGRLSPAEIQQALCGGARIAEELVERGLIHGAALCVADQLRIVPEVFTLRHRAKRRPPPFGARGQQKAAATKLCRAFAGDLTHE
jgi:uncharacterized protein